MRNATMFRRRKTFRFDALVFAVVTTMLGLMLPIAAFAQRVIAATMLCQDQDQDRLLARPDDPDHVNAIARGLAERQGREVSCTRLGAGLLSIVWAGPDIRSRNAVYKKLRRSSGTTSPSRTLVKPH